MPRIRQTRAQIRRWVTQETISGVILLVAAMAALVWANSPWRDTYAALVGTRVGPAELGLDLTVAQWAADGLLAVFFFVVGVELKHELRVGSLSNPREAAVPMLAAVGGMIVPAVLYTSVVLVSGERTDLVGWAIPTATDIAFAFAVLAVFGRGLPTALRTFLLTLAVVDDLLAIIVIAIFYTSGVELWSLAAAFACVAVFRWMVTRRWARWWLLLPIALLAWWLMHESGVHATVAGVLLGFCVPAAALRGESQPRTLSYGEAISPVSSGFALPVFAFMSAGVTVVDAGFASIFGSPVALGVLAGLMLGKVVGVLGTTALVTGLTAFRLPQGIGVRDLLGVGFLTGIGFTVALLVTELSFPAAIEQSSGKAGVLLASFCAAILGMISLRWDARKARSHDMNRDGIPDNITEIIGE